MTLRDALRVRAEGLTSRRILFPALAVLVLAVLGVAYLASDSYTIAVVDGESISFARFSKNYRAAAAYYENFTARYGAVSSSKMTERDLKAAVLDRLIEAALIDRAARREAGDALGELVDERTARYRDDENLRGAAERLYDMSPRDFHEEVLMPQAKADILRGRLFLRGETLDAWLVGTKKASKVLIFSDEFTWNGKRVAAK